MGGERTGWRQSKAQAGRVLSQPNAAARDKGMRTSSTSGVQSCLFFCLREGREGGGDKVAALAEVCHTFQSSQSFQSQHAVTSSQRRAGSRRNPPREQRACSARH